MSDRVPPGAFADAAKLESAQILRPDGKPATAFTTRATALAEMRAAVNDHEADIAELRQEVASLPFPFVAHG